jgi:hypothetical protein
MKSSKKTYKIKILEINQLTHDVKQFKTTKPRNYKFTPGQATELAINKENFKDRFHPFTFTSLPEEGHLEFTIKSYSIDKYPNHSGVTEKINELQVGDQFIIKQPVGTIEYKGKGVFLAGGAGITPFIAIFKQLKKRNKLTGNTLIFSNKEKRDVILANELKEWFTKDHLILTLTQQKIKGYEYGRIDKRMIKKYVDNTDQYFYICGPSGFEEDLRRSLLGLGAEKEKVIIEEW